MAAGTTYINIDDSDGDFFFTKSQIEKKRRRHFIDTSHGSYVPTSSSVEDLLSRPPNRTRVNDQRSQDYLSSGTLDIRRYGTEITDIKQWMAGTIKISAGTEGHIVEPVCLGAEDQSIFGPDVHYDRDKFEPVSFIELQVNNFDAFIASDYFPLVISDNVILDVYRTNGIIEPLSIRPEASFLSVEVPFESRGIKGTILEGNDDIRLSSDAVLTVDYYEPGRVNESYFLDAGTDVRDESGGSATGVSLPYFNTGHNEISPYDDAIKPRGVSLSTTYTLDMIDALSALSQSTSFYVSEKQRSATSGFVYDNTNPQGTDSIAFGGMLY